MNRRTITAPHEHAPAHTAQVEHHKEDASGYTWSCSADIILPQIDEVQGHTQTHPQSRNWDQWLHCPVVAQNAVCSVAQCGAVSCMRAPHCRTVLYNGTTKPRKHLQEAIYHEIFARTSSRYQAFEKLLWKPNEDTSQKSSGNQMSLKI